jgi:hypothetical protein
MAVQDRVRGSAEQRTRAETAALVQEAQTAMREVIAADPSRVWTARELQDAACDDGPWSDSIQRLAFWGLVEAGELWIDENLGVHSRATG